MGSRIIQELQDSPLHETLPFLIKLSERVVDAVSAAGTFQSECADVGKQADVITQLLRSAVRISASQTFYDRPLRRVAAELSHRLFRSAALVRKCKRRHLLRRLFTVVTKADLRRVQGLLGSSIADLKWVLRVLDPDAAGHGGGHGGHGGGYGGGIISLPPIASNDPILAWVWSSIASIQMGISSSSTQLSDVMDGVNSLISLAQDSERNKKIIAEEGGVPPLLRLLKEKSSSPESQVAAAIALLQLANTQERIRLISDNAGVQIVGQALGDSPIRVQVHVADLVAKMAEKDASSKEGFAKENVIRPLVTALALECYPPLENEPRPHLGSIGSIAEINGTKNRYHKPNMSSRGHRRRNTENERPEVIHKLKLSCSRALWMLARGSISNSTRITETIGLLYLAKIIEKETGELQFNCLMTISEIASAAESNPDLRRAAFKTNSPAAKAVVEQLLRVVKESESSMLRAAAIGAIGSLSRTFPARETRVVVPLVEQLSNKDRYVATEAAVALGKFASPDNFLCMEHSKTIIQSNGVPPLMRLLSDERTQFPGLTLICYLAIHAGSSEALEEAKVLTNLEVAEKIVSPRHPELKELVRKAIVQLSLYRAGLDPGRDVPFGRFAIDN